MTASSPSWPASAPLPLQALSRRVLQDRYAAPGELTPDDVRRRVAAALAQAESGANRGQWAGRFLQAQRAGFIVGGRVAAHAGAGRTGTMLNCFVQPVSDTLRPQGSGRPGLYEALGEAAQTQRLGGGVGIDFSAVRPQGARVRGCEAVAAGPAALLKLFDASSAVLSAGWQRPGAQMGVLRCDHPDIESFLAAKASGGLDSFHLGVAVTDDFMHAVERGQTIELVHRAAPGPGLAGAIQRRDGLWVYRRVPAARIWEALVGQAHARGEPGLLFVDRINADNNLAYCETLAATNPCGEQPLPPYGACCLGSVDLTRLVRRPFAPGAALDLGQLAAIVPVAVRMLDNVLALTEWPLARQRDEALSKRRIGLGFTGLADALVMLGLRYGEPAALALVAGLARLLRDAAYAASIALARERGAFALFDPAGVLREGSFASRLPADLRHAIRQSGLRNSHLLSIAPTGGISLAFADNASPGIEPVLAWCRSTPDPAGSSFDGVGCVGEDHAWRLYRQIRGPDAPLPAAFATATSLPPQAHLATVAAVAPWVDGGIAKTVNLPMTAGTDVVASVLRDAWRLGLKGVTVYRVKSPLAAAPSAVHGRSGPWEMSCPAH